MVKRVLQIMAVVSVLFCGSVQAAPILTLDPVGGAISGTPGSTIGWGFCITNLSDYLLVTGADFIPATPVGTFTDFISTSNFIVVGPSPENSTVAQVFDPFSLTGIGSFAISGLAVPGTVTGQIVLTYDLFSVSPNDPLFNPDTDTLNPTSRQLSADASVTVESSTPVPEPSTFLLLAGGVGLIFIKRRFARKA